jgi:hypothetical protein
MKTTPSRVLKVLRAEAFAFAGLLSAAILWLPAGNTQAATPPDPLIELRFPEGLDLATTNTGTLAENAFFDLGDSTNYPGFSTNVPVGVYVPADNPYSVDMGIFVGNTTFGRAVDMTNTIQYLAPMSQLTISGWLNAREIARVGQIAYALETVGGLGFDLANDSIGRLSLGINEGSGNNPSVLRLTADPNAGSNHWVFFAVTYDSTLPSGQLKYYFGRGDKLAYLDSAYTYVGGDVTSTLISYAYSPTFGNYSTVDPLRDTISAAGSGIFRGLMDELKVYTNALTLDQVQQAQINGSVTPVTPTIISGPSDKQTPQGQDAIFEVDASGSGLLSYQWKTNGVNVLGATNSSFTLSSVTLAQIGLLVRVGVTNAVGGVLSTNATLNVLPANPHLESLSFVEGNTKSTNYTLTPGQQGALYTADAAGIMQGGGNFVQKQSTGNAAGTYPVFSANVPVGTNAPAAPYNQFSLNMGDVQYDTNGVAPGVQGGRAVDFTNAVASPANSLGKMSGLTICGWINAGSLTWRGTGNFHNQLANAQNADNSAGFGLAHKSDNSLQLAVNESVGGSTVNRSSPNMIVNNTNHPASNWRFFAVTYDGSVTTANLNFYWGDGNTLATNDTVNPLSYDRGILTNTGPFTLGNFNATTTSSGRIINGDNAAFFRGLIDEFHIFSRVLTITEIQQMQTAAPMPPVLVISNRVNDVVLSWAANTPPLLTGLQLQARTNAATGTWSDVTNPTNVSETVRSVALPHSGDTKFFRLRSQ